VVTPSGSTDTEGYSANVGQFIVIICEEFAVEVIQDRVETSSVITRVLWDSCSIDCHKCFKRPKLRTEQNSCGAPMSDIGTIFSV